MTNDTLKCTNEGEREREEEEREIENNLNH